MSGKLGMVFPSQETLSQKYSSGFSMSAVRTDFHHIQNEKAQEATRNVTSYSLGICDRIRLLYSKELYADVQFVLKDPKKQSKSLYPAHRNILAIGSPVFAEMLYSEKANSIHSFPITITVDNIAYEAFGNVIEFLYTDDAYFENIFEATETLVAARRFEVPALVKHCENFLNIEPLSTENVCTALQQANAMRITNLKERSLKFIEENTQKVIKSNDFLSSTITTLKIICKAEKLSLKSEVELFEALVEWARRQNGRPRTLLEPLLKHVRFFTMQTAEFGTLVEKYAGFFSEGEALSIMVHIANPNVGREVPKWCNKGEKRCFLLSSPSTNVNSTQKPSQNKQNPISCSTDSLYQPNGNILTIALKPFHPQPLNLTALTSVLEMKCSHGRYQVDGFKMAFQTPVYKESYVELQVILLVKPSGYCLKQCLKIRNSENIYFDFKERVLFGTNDTLTITAKATNIQSYDFLQFDAKNSFSEIGSPFTCNICSIPKDNHLFFISEVLFKAPQPAKFRAKPNMKKR